jgi:hypothetical protein
MVLLPTGTAADIGDTVPADYWKKVGELLNSGGTFYNVRNPDFGAVGDGSNDDTAEIQACINASSPGDTILFPPGIYGLSAPIVRKHDRHYLGVGGWSDATVLKVLSGSSANFQNAAGLSGVFVPESWNTNATVAGGRETIQGIAIDGNLANNATGQHAGFVLHGNFWSQYADLRAYNCKKAGLHMTGVGKDGTTSMATGLSDFLFRDIFMASNQGDGVRSVMASNGAYHSDVTWTGACRLFSNDGSGMFVENAGGWAIDGEIHHWQNGKHGVYLEGGYALRVGHVYCEDFGRLGTSGETLFGLRARVFDGRGAHIHDCVIDAQTTPIAGVTHICLSVAGGGTDVHAWVTDCEVIGISNANVYGFDIWNGDTGSHVLNLHEHGNIARGFLDAAHAKQYVGSGAFTYDPPRRMTATTTWNPASATTGTAQSTTVTVTGAAVGDPAVASLTTMPTGTWLLSAQVTAANTVTVTLRNDSGGTVDPASGTLRVTVWKH